MKKFIAIIAIMAAMFTVNATTANAQMNYDDINYRIAKSHTTEYIQKGDDAYRMGRYQEAMDHYKRAREYNSFRGHTIVPSYDIESKMDRCANAMRGGNRTEQPSHRHHRGTETAAAVVGGVLLGGILASVLGGDSKSNGKEAAASNDDNTLCEVTSNGISYSTTSANKYCRVLSVKNEFDYTVVEMEFIDAKADHTISIDRTTYLKDRNSGAKLSLKDVENIAVKGSTSVAAGDSHVFRLYFDRTNGTEVDVIEPGTSSWKFYHVPVKTNDVVTRN